MCGGGGGGVVKTDSFNSTKHDACNCSLSPLFLISAQRQK